MSVGERTLTLVKFLKLAETRPPSEYIDGRVEQKVSPKARHSWLQLLIAESINHRTRPSRVGLAFPELRCTFAGRSYVYDVSYFRMDRIAYGPDGELVDDVFLPPDLAVEILSPGQSLRSAEAKLRWSVQHGVRLGWFIDAIHRRVKVFSPGTRPKTLETSHSLDGANVISGFRLPVNSVFEWLKKPQ